MKFNQWTLGLAALGVVSLASAAKAEEKMSVVQSALSSTTISGYVDTSAVWNTGNGTGMVAPVSFMNSSKADGFNLNVVQLTIAKALDESEWASGYRADFWMGPDADLLGSQSVYSSSSKASNGDFAIRQAYVALRAPVGNGIDFKVGVFDTVIGYETLESGSNPHYTHSYGFTIEPTTHTGVLATYRLNDSISFSGGIANTTGPSINERAHGPNTGSGGDYEEYYKAYMGSVALTAPSDWGWASGSTLYAGFVNGYGSGLGEEQMNLYAGATLATPITGLKVGLAFDYLYVDDAPSDADNLWAVGAYASYQATEKLSFHARWDYLKGENPVDDLELVSLTGTVQYDLWENVISRLEVRWDHCLTDGIEPFGGSVGSGTASASSGSSDVSELEGRVSDLEDYVYYYGKKYSGSSSSYYEDSWSNSDYGLAGAFLSAAGAPPPGSADSGQENAVLVALQLIYKF